MPNFLDISIKENLAVNLYNKNVFNVIDKAVGITIRELGYDDSNHFEISVLITDDDQIKKLNNMHRNIDSSTDVLSFPQFNTSDNIEALPSGEIYLGDVVISAETAMRQSSEFYHSYEREIFYLTVHSILHLFGYDHMNTDDKKVMRELEKKIVATGGYELDEKNN